MNKEHCRWEGKCVFLILEWTVSSILALWFNTAGIHRLFFPPWLPEKGRSREARMHPADRRTHVHSNIHNHHLFLKQRAHDARSINRQNRRRRSNCKNFNKTSQSAVKDGNKQKPCLLFLKWDFNQTNLHSINLKYVWDPRADIVLNSHEQFLKRTKCRPRYYCINVYRGNLSYYYIVNNR